MSDQVHNQPPDLTPGPLDLPVPEPASELTEVDRGAAVTSLPGIDGRESRQRATWGATFTTETQRKTSRPYTAEALGSLGMAAEGDTPQRTSGIKGSTPSSSPPTTEYEQRSEDAVAAGATNHPPDGSERNEITARVLGSGSEGMSDQPSAADADSMEENPSVRVPGHASEAAQPDSEPKPTRETSQADDSPGDPQPDQPADIALPPLEQRSPAEAVHGAVSEFGFTTLPNPSIEDVSRIFGHEISEEPALVVLTEENQKIVDEQRAGGVSFNYNPMGATYDQHNNIIFVSEFASIVYASRLEQIYAHETAHAFINDINPELGRLMEQLGEAYAAHGDGERTESVVDPEEVAVVTSLHEGIADWVSIENLPSAQTAIRAQNKLLSGQDWSGTDKQEPEKLQTNMEWVKRSFDRLIESAALSEQSFEETEPAAIRNLQRQARSTIKEGKYVAGYFFIHRAMEHLRSSGATPEELSSRLVKLIKTPPRTIEDLGNPVAFINR